jgi:Subtilase family
LIGLGSLLNEERPSCRGREDKSMKSKAFCILVVLLGLSTAISGAAAQPGLPAPAAGLENINRWKAAKQKDAAIEWRQIGFLKKGVKKCPEAEGWKKPHSLLELAFLDAKITEEEFNREREEYSAPESLSKLKAAGIKLANQARFRKSGLDRVCVYTAIDPRNPNLQSLPPEIKAAPDRLALSTTSAGGPPSDSLSQTIWRTLAGHFREQTLRSPGTSDTSRVLIPMPVEPSVRLTFIDSQPEGEGFPLAPSNGSPHGFTLAYLARGVVCPVPEHCAALVATRRALSFGDFTPGDVMPQNELANSRSGHVGLVSDLAVAITAEVLHWQQFDRDKKLILNLSLGWDGELFGDLRDLKRQKLSKLDPSVQAVYKALCFARRSGALVIAAAGNQRGADNESASPLLPAAWELNRPTWLPFFLGRKPVYAVGGVDSQGMPLSNSRRGGLPRRATYADHAVAAAESPNDPTALYTGTSVSAAVASSITAVVWHLRPDLSPSEVMRLVTRSGEPLPFRADFYAWKKLWPLSKIFKAPRAKGLSLCQAVASACGPDGSRCPALSSLPACPGRATTLPAVAAPLRALSATGGSAIELPAGSGSSEPPDIASERWILPQPEATPCPSCTLVPDPTGGGTASLMLEISNEWNPEGDVILDDATIFINGSPSYHLSSAHLTRGSVHRLSGLARGRFPRSGSILISFHAHKGEELMSILNPVLVVDP